MISYVLEKILRKGVEIVRKKGRRRRLSKALFVAGGLASLAAGATVCLLLQSAPHRDAPALSSAPWRQGTAVPLPPDPPAQVAPRRDEVVCLPAGRPGRRADIPPTTVPIPTSPSPRAVGAPSGAAANAKKTREAGPDLSAYRVRARSSSGDSLLPGDSSLSAEALTESLKPQKKASRNDEGGWVGDVYRGALRAVRSIDEATLAASRSALHGVADPSSARLRPGGGGVRLKIEIPPETIGKRKK